SIALFFVLRWVRRMGIGEDQAWGLFLWTAIAGLVGGRLYFVIQQPDLVQHYLLQPINIIAVWNGGMAFFGAIFLGSAALFVLGPRYGFDRFLAIDAGALFAAIGQIFGRFGNIINGDILGMQAGAAVNIPANICAHSPCIAYVSDPHILPWAVVYLNTHSFAIQGIPYQPAPVYEILLNVIMLAILWPLRFTLPRLRAGLFFTLYAFMYGLSQLIVFFFRGSEPITPFLGVNIFKQAQWTGIVVMLLCILLYYLVNRFARPWPFSDAKPEPWPLPAGGLAVAHSSLTAVASSAARNTRGSAKGTAATSRISSVVRRTGTARTAVAPPPSDAPAIELPPWEPTRATNGRLRNMFASGGAVPSKRE
ncbi:MAG: prolipoprotein diacylglyceryl transferase family protein, partial [Ktedonobacterales bacterium]